MSRRIALLLIALSLQALTSPAQAQDKAASKPAPGPKPQTHKVRAEPFRIEVKLSGVFESAGMAEVYFDPKVASALSVLKAVEHGTKVAKGDTLVWPMLQKTDKAIQAKAHAEAPADLALQQAREELKQLKVSTPRKLAQAALAAKRAGEDLKQFTENRKLAEKAARETCQASLDRLAYIKEELRQLKKMYEADDLTEETEEIVLRRTKDAVRRSELAAEQAKVKLDITLKTDLPRQARDLALANEAATTANENAKIVLPLALKTKELGVAAADRSRTKAKKDLADLKSDRDAMTVKAPRGGVVYYGRCTRGKWSGGPALAAKLIRNGKLSGDEVFMTIVDPKSLFVRASVAEKDLGLLKAGQVGKAAAAAYPQTKLAVKLDKFSTVPLASGQFDARFALPGGAGRATAGMTCSITLVAHDNPKALTVPQSAVFAEEGKEFVNLVRGDAKVKREVKTGRRHGGKVEILAGLAEGDTVLRKAQK